MAVAVAAETGIYSGVYPLLLAGVIASGIIVPVIVYATSKAFRGYIEAIGLRALTTFHVWRIAAALLFFWYGAHSLLPKVFVQNAGYGATLLPAFWLGVVLLPKTQSISRLPHLRVRRFRRGRRNGSDPLPAQ